MGWFDGIRESNRHKRDLAEQAQERLRVEQIMQDMRAPEDYTGAWKPGMEGNYQVQGPTGNIYRQYGPDEMPSQQRTLQALARMGGVEALRPYMQAMQERKLMESGAMDRTMYTQDLASADRRRGQDVSQITGLGKTVLAQGGALPQFGIEEPLPVPTTQAIANRARAQVSNENAATIRGRRPGQIAADEALGPQREASRKLALARIAKIEDTGGVARLPEALKIPYTQLLQRIGQIRSNQTFKPYEQDAQIQQLFDEFAPLLPGIIEQTQEPDKTWYGRKIPARYGMRAPVLQGRPGPGENPTAALPSAEDLFTP